VETSVSGVGMVRALTRVSEISALGLGELDLSGVPQRRVVALAWYGMAATATALRRHPEPRRVATLLATVRSLDASAVDDALELFDVLMTNDLLARGPGVSQGQGEAAPLSAAVQGRGQARGSGRGAARRARAGGAVGA
jgi:hypothetical protein